MQSVSARRAEARTHVDLLACMRSSLFKLKLDPFGYHKDILWLACPAYISTTVDIYYITLFAKDQVGLG